MPQESPENSAPDEKPVDHGSPESSGASDTSAGSQPPPYGRPYGTPPPAGWTPPQGAAAGAPPQGPAWAPAHGHGPAPAAPPYGSYAPVPGDPTLAEFWQRIVARLLDGVVVSVILSPLMIWYFAWYFGHAPDLTPTDPNDPAAVHHLLVTELRLMGVSLLFGAAVAVVTFFYDWFQHTRWGQTVGKRVVKTKVVMVADRSPVTGGAAAARAGMYALVPQIPLAGSLYGLLDSLWLLWDKPNRQCLHDKVARTVVIKTDVTRP
jgi:uncharacterized RDD family membrane protein YckC